MRTYPLHEARAEFSKLVDRALAGQPQRVTRYGKKAVVIMSQAEWATRPKTAAMLGKLLANFAERTGFSEDDFYRPGRAPPGRLAPTLRTICKVPCTSSAPTLYRGSTRAGMAALRPSSAGSAATAPTCS